MYLFIVLLVGIWVASSWGYYKPCCYEHSWKISVLISIEYRDMSSIITCTCYYLYITTYIITYYLYTS